MRSGVMSVSRNSRSNSRSNSRGSSRGGEGKDGLLSVMGDMQELRPNISYLGKHGVASLHGIRLDLARSLLEPRTGLHDCARLHHRSPAASTARARVTTCARRSRRSRCPSSPSSSGNKPAVAVHIHRSGRHGEERHGGRAEHFRVGRAGDSVLVLVE